MNDKTDRPGGPNTSGGTTIAIGEVKFGKLVQQPRGPVVTGFEHAITSRTRDVPPDVVDACRPDLLVPADANPIQMVETWAQERGGLVIVPLLRPKVSPSDNLWIICGRIRPYTERGVGQGGRPASMMTAWPLPAAGFGQIAPSLVGAMAAHFQAEPELGSTSANERMAREPVKVPALEPSIPNAGAIPRPAMVMIEALRRGMPTRWTKATFADEAEFLKCLAVVYRLIPNIPGGVSPRALLSASSGLAIGADNFLISFVRDGAPSKLEEAQQAQARQGKTPIPPAWDAYLAKSAAEPIAELVARAERGGRSPPRRGDPGRYVFGHAEQQDDAWASQGLVDALAYYLNPGYVRTLNTLGDTVRRNLGQQAQQGPQSPPYQPAAGSAGQRTVLPQNIANHILPQDRRGSSYPAPREAETNVARLYARSTSQPQPQPQVHVPQHGFAKGVQSPPQSAAGREDYRATPQPTPATVDPRAFPSASAPPSYRVQPAAPRAPAVADPWIARTTNELQRTAQSSGESFAVMQALVERMLYQGVLDNAEMRQLFEWSGSANRDIVREITEWTRHAFPGGDQVNTIQFVIHRSAALQAWRNRMHPAGDAGPRMSPLDEQVAGYALRWRDNFMAREGPQWCARMAGEASVALIDRTAKGYPPEIDLDELGLLKPMLVDSSMLGEIATRLTSVIRQVPPPTELNGMPPNSAADFLRRLRVFLESVH